MITPWSFGNNSWVNRQTQQFPAGALNIQPTGVPTGIPAPPVFKSTGDGGSTGVPTPMMRGAFRDPVNNLAQQGQGGSDGGRGLGGGNPGAGQPGSAGTGWGKTASDALMGLIGGQIAGPAFGIATALSRAVTDPGYSPFGFGPSYGQGYAANPGAITNSKEIDNMGINPSAYGLANAAVSRTGQMTQDEPSRSADASVSQGDNPGILGSSGYTGAQSTAATSGSGSSAGTGQGAEGASIGGQGSGPGGIGGVGGGSGTDQGGIMAKGGIIRGPAPRDPSKDNLRITAQGGEFVAPRQEVKMFGPELELMRRLSLPRQQLVRGMANV